MPTGNMTFNSLYYKTVNENGEPIGEPITLGDTITLKFDRAYPYEPTWMELGLRARITNVIFNPPATIVFWNDKTKTVVKCQDDDEWDAEKGLAMAIAKKYFGNRGRYNKEFKKWIGERSI